MIARGQEWSGLPMPMPGLPLEIEKTHPCRDRILELEAGFNEGSDDESSGLTQDLLSDEEGTWTVRNSWWSTRTGRMVAIITDGTRYRVARSRDDYVRRFAMAIDTLRASAAWTIETEIAAIETLSGHLKDRPHLWEAYIATGSFIETSARSGVTYLFRRCRPTVAFRDQRLLCTLCLHPLAYYRDTHAGGMCQTENDVIAHLLLMRADEHFFWRKANQHPPDHPESGL